MDVDTANPKCGLALGYAELHNKQVDISHDFIPEWKGHICFSPNWLWSVIYSRSTNTTISNVLLILKSHRISKFNCPRNVAASICQLVSKNAALEISLHGKGLSAMYVYAHIHFTCIQIGLLLKLCMHMWVNLCRRRPRNLATPPNRALK